MTSVAHRKEKPGISIERVKDYIKPQVWDTINSHKDYQYVESIAFTFGFDDEGEPVRGLSLQYLRGTFGTRFKESHLNVPYDTILKTYLKSNLIQSLDTITENDLYRIYFAHGDAAQRNPLATRIVSMEVDLTGKNTIKIEVGIPKGRGNRIIEVINVKALH